MIPEKLYRGDADNKNQRNLRYTCSQQQFCTNLIKGGEGRKIFSEPILDLVNKHILSRFDNSHFLSFTESRTAAMRYGLNLITDDTDAIEECYVQSYNEKNDWDFVLLTLNTSHLTIINNPVAGLYECIYKPILKEFSTFEVYRIFLIDVNKALNAANIDKYNIALEYSSFDREWLLLPAMPKEFNSGKVEYSAILDGACFESPEFFTIDREKFNLNNTLNY
ncbi:MAG: hypothetical protein ACOVNP_04505 [Flavobacterium sp.]